MDLRTAHKESTTEMGTQGDVRWNRGERNMTGGQSAVRINQCSRRGLPSATRSVSNVGFEIKSVLFIVFTVIVLLVVLTASVQNCVCRPFTLIATDIQ